MSCLNVDPVVTDSFGIEPALRDDTLSVKLTGTGDMAASLPLGRYVKALEGEVIRLSVSTVEFDVRGSLHELELPQGVRRLHLRPDGPWPQMQDTVRHGREADMAASEPEALDEHVPGAGLDRGHMIREPRP